MCEVPPLAELAGDKQAILDLAAQYAAKDGNAKSAAVDAAIVYWRAAIWDAVQHALDSAVEMHEMLEGSLDDSTDAEAWHSDLETAALNAATTGELLLDSVMAPHITGVDLATADTRAQAAEDIARGLVEVLRPAPEDAGKWLAQIGIVKSDLDALETHVVKLPVDGRHVVLPPGSKCILPGDNGGYIQNTSDTPMTASIQASGITPSPSLMADPASLSAAYQLIYEPSNADVDALAKALDVSRSTLMNWLSGRVAKAKCSAVQAVALVADCERRIAALRQAKATFAAVV